MNSIKATYYDGVQAVSHAVTLTLYNEQVQLSGPSIQHSWRYEDIIVVDRHRGSFSHAATPNARLVIESSADARALVAKLPKTRTGINWRFAANCAGLMVVILCLVFIIIPYLAPYAVPYMPKEWDARFGAYGYDVFLDGSQCKGAEGQAALNGLLAKLTSDMGSPYPYQVAVDKRRIVNAVTFPGGSIIIFSELIKQAAGPEELAGVLAHEIAHTEKRHGMHMLVRALATTFVVDVLTGGGGTLVYAGTLLRDMKYSRTNEAEADEFALQLLQRHNIDPTGMAQFFERLDQRAKRKSKSAETDAKNDEESIFDLLESHPANKSRHTYILKGRQDRRTYTPPLTNAEWNAIKTTCR